MFCSSAFFKFQSTPDFSVSDQRHESTVLFPAGVIIYRQTYLGFEMTSNSGDTSSLRLLIGFTSVYRNKTTENYISL